MAWLKATVTGREMRAELPSLLFILFQRRGSIRRGTQYGRSALGMRHN